MIKVFAADGDESVTMTMNTHSSGIGTEAGDKFNEAVRTTIRNQIKNHFVEEICFSNWDSSVLMVGEIVHFSESFISTMLFRYRLNFEQRGYFAPNL